MAVPVGAGLFPGLGGGFGKSLNMDLDMGANGGLFGGAGIPLPFGLGGGGGPFGGIPFGGGWGGVPYVPVTPLGALGGFKGDLLVPIVAVGVGLFLLILVVMAVKAALAWKVSLISDLANKKKMRRDIGAGGPPEEDQLNRLADTVLTAIRSQVCAQNMICQVGTYVRSTGVNGLLRILEDMGPVAMHDPLEILRSSAEGTFNCNEKYHCGPQKTGTDPPPPPAPTPQMNSVNKTSSF